MCYVQWYKATKSWLRFIIDKALKNSVADPVPESDAFLTPGSGMGRFGIRIRDEQPGSFSESLEKFFGVYTVHLNSLMRIQIQDPESYGPQIRDGKNSYP
jgi:hypothetical protein